MMNVLKSRTNKLKLSHVQTSKRIVLFELCFISIQMK